MKNHGSAILLSVMPAQMSKFIIQWQDQFGNWQRFQEKHNQADAFRTAQARARSTGKRHRLVDVQGHLIDLIEP